MGEWLNNGTFAMLQWCYNFSLDWGMAIIILTIIFRILIAPIANKQIKSTYAMQKLQPKIKAIQTKYANDQQRQQEETMKVYQEAKFNPLNGCLPMLLQMPIFLILFTVLNNMASYGTAGTVYTFYNLVPDLTMRPGGVWTDSGPVAAIPYIILVAIFGLSIIIPALIQSKQSNDSTSKQTLITSLFMSVFMIWIGWTSPAGVLLFWDVSSIIGIAQQYIVQAIMKHKDEEKAAEATEVEVAPIEVDVQRKARKSKPTKKGR